MFLSPCGLSGHLCSQPCWKLLATSGLWFKQFGQVPVLKIQFRRSFTDHLPQVNLTNEELHVICSGITWYLLSKILSTILSVYSKYNKFSKVFFECWWFHSTAQTKLTILIVFGINPKTEINKRFTTYLTLNLPFCKMVGLQLPLFSEILHC